jgi:hypothetical protein
MTAVHETAAHGARLAINLKQRHCKVRHDLSRMRLAA